jgi:hypothetical protein
MSIDFSSASHRAAGGNLTVSVSPLGLVELADEEFEVHGPRLQRYAAAWAFYLGHHWGYRREAGEPQVTFNYVKAFTDYIINFTFGRGVSFRSPKETDSIVPDLLKRVWEVDNDKESILYEMGQQGGVTGDVFLKVAYEEPRLQPPGPEAGAAPLEPGIEQAFVPGKVRILPLNSSFCFPEWHPHDRNRLIRFKLKYRFWGTSNEGTRQVFTYTEILTDTVIEEYVNDELISSRPNPMGEIPIVHIPNTAVSGSPWGLGDCESIHSLNRQYNEIATDIADIINYHAAPVTVITGAKASQLEKGPKKVWGGLPKEAQVFNLENGVNLAGPMDYMAMLKTAMHEMVGVPESALGQLQPISNTSGVALSIQFQPLMNRYTQKITQYSLGLQRVNTLVMKLLVLKEPQNLQWNPSVDTELADGQVPVLNPDDPITYQSFVHWAPPLPLDKLVLLQELQMKQQMGLESREGMLRALGEEFPDEKLAEIRAELIEDAKSDGALNLVNTAIQAELAALTGMLSGNATDAASILPTDGGGGPGGAGGGANSAPSPMVPQSQMPSMLDPAAVLAGQGEYDIRNDLVTRAYGTKVPLRKLPGQES